ncbi:MAG: Uncharacterised protein [Gammaproteobacteria bacterium]|nr:MAG: Uncharacterised protein [Gammaproteobacteria bacterium]|tara:strand:- start:44 stop:664 length:621 start_codon:yes stop_codon:yes gene_type:complete
MIEKEFTIQTRVSDAGKKKGATTGTLCFTGIRFQKKDKSKFKQLFYAWSKYKIAGEFCSQRANIPEGLTEGLVAKDIEGIYRKGEKNDTKSKYPTTKFDCYDSLKDRIVEVKGCSIPNDLTSWSPKPYFDVFYFVDFSSMDGKYSIYKINTTDTDIKKEVVNKKTGKTYQQIVDAGNRPRFSVFEKYIQPKYKCTGNPVFSGDLNK